MNASVLRLQHRGWTESPYPTGCPILASVFVQSCQCRTSSRSRTIQVERRITEPQLILAAESLIDLDVPLILVLLKRCCVSGVAVRNARVDGRRQRCLGKGDHSCIDQVGGNDVAREGIANKFSGIRWVRSSRIRVIDLPRVITEVPSKIGFGRYSIECFCRASILKALPSAKDEGLVFNDGPAASRTVLILTEGSLRGQEGIAS